ncbi:MAG: epoxyqueuosine reductase [Chloroflexi bacterium]|nr:epoxyqueuosine reductase [Chloroflexota bacterium]MBT7082013.1 epoxyqueuosine reductase [Chloroflexota bacterium]MBT7289684.1 epoxyqueuosine reductase [Chloroflexota bacterium]
MSIADKLKNSIMSSEASLVGYADLSGFRADMRADMPVGVSIAVALDPKIIAEINYGPTNEYNAEYKRANRLLTTLGNLAAETLKSDGYKARALAPTDEGLNLDTLTRLLPHKTAATRAGLGWIGKCALLVTKDYGSALRLTTVFTDANLPMGTPVNQSMCG